MEDVSPLVERESARSIVAPDPRHRERSAARARIRSAAIVAIFGAAGGLACLRLQPSPAPSRGAAAKLFAALGDTSGLPKDVAAATDKLAREAEGLAGEAQRQREAAKAAMKMAEDRLKSASSSVETAERELEVAAKQTKEAEEALRKERAAKSAQKQRATQASEDISAAKAQRADSQKDLAVGEHLLAKAGALQAAVDGKATGVVDLETRAAASASSHRECFDVPGGRLRKAGAAADFKPLAMKRDVASVDACRRWCQEHEGCAQMIFANGQKDCQLFSSFTTDVADWNADYTSAICADKSQSSKLKASIKEVYSHKPWIPPVTDCAWAGDECGKSKCCNDASCAWDFSKCKPYSCYQDGPTATCKPTESWSTGKIIGAARQIQQLAPAPKGVTLGGTTLFCFMVVYWQSPEWALADNLKKQRLSITECDGQSVLSGSSVEKTPWSTLMNAAAFEKHLQQIREEKTYLQYDWTVKVDADAVFFPQVLKMRLAALRVPEGAPAYIRNLDYKFKFQGALEVYSREALQLYFDKGSACAEKVVGMYPKSGEDFVMYRCMEVVGAASIEDLGVLRDNTCGTACGGASKDCYDGKVAAFHAYRDADSWNKCHGQALEAQKKIGTLTWAGRKTAAPKLSTFLRSSAPEAKKSASLLRQAGEEMQKLGPDFEAAANERKRAQVAVLSAKTQMALAAQRIQDAKDLAADAAAEEEKARRNIKVAMLSKEQASSTRAVALATRQRGEQEESDARQEIENETAQLAEADDETHRAAEIERAMLHKVEEQRLCMDLPSVRLASGRSLEPHMAALEVPIESSADCSNWCRKQKLCKQSIWSGAARHCYLFAEAAPKPIAFTEEFNSSYCGLVSEAKHIHTMLDAVYKMKPWLPPPPNCAWAGDNCIYSKCCANVPIPNWHFTEFKWYTCYKQNEAYAACRTDAPPPGWDGTVLGRANTRETPPAPEGVLTQGTTLFCFSVVMWNHPAPTAFWDSEAALANNIKATKRSILGCEGNAFFQGAELGNGGDSSSKQNINSFIQVWQTVQDDGRYLQYDWTVKVDADAVFFPDRLRMHLDNLRTPQGARVYLRNIKFKFQFLGALEVFTKEALQHYFAHAGECSEKVGHEGGEDYWMVACMDGIGVEHQTDFKLLNDKYAATGNCGDPWVVGFHFYKSVAHWNQCHDEAVQSAKMNNNGYWVNEK